MMAVACLFFQGEWYEKVEERLNAKCPVRHLAREDWLTGNAVSKKSNSMRERILNEISFE